MSLTPEGAGLLPRVEKLLQDLAAIEQAAGLPVAAPHVLRVGAGDALGRRTLPRALAKLLRTFPDLDIQLREGPQPALLSAVRRGEIDVALLVEPDDPATAPGLQLEFILESPVVLLAPASEEQRQRFRLAALADRRWVALQEGSGFRRHIEAACRQAGVHLRPSVEVGNLSLVRRFVAAGLGLAPVPAVAFGTRATAGVHVAALSGVSPVRYVAACRAGAPLSAPVQRLLADIRH